MKKQRHWLDFAEYASLVGLGVGSVASFVSSQVLYTSAPLSLLVLLNLANRRRFEQVTRQDTAIAVNDMDRKLSKHVELLNQQVLALPTPEAMGSLKKSLLIKNREVLEQLSSEITALQREMLGRLTNLEQQNLGSMRQDVSQLQAQHNQLCGSIAGLTAQINDLADPTRLENLESAIAKLRADAMQLRNNLQSLSDQTKPSLNSLQDQINHLNRQLQKLPPPFDSTALKQEVAELIRVVADLVPKRDWNNLAVEIKTLQQQYETRIHIEDTLRRQILELSQQLQSRPAKSNLTSLQNQINHLNRQFQKLPAPFDPTSLKREVAELMKAVAGLVPKRDWNALLTQIKALQQQQEFQNQFEETLQIELQALSQQLQILAIAPPAPQPPATDVTEPEVQEQQTLAVPTPQPQQEFQERIEALLNRELQAIDRQLQALPSSPQLQAQIEETLSRELQEINQHLRAFPTAPRYELMFDFKSAQPQDSSNVGTSQMLLEQALEATQERLILVWPWSSQCSLDEAMMHKLEALLNRGCRLDLGWCHLANRDEERFLSPINQRWSIHAMQQGLQTTLQKLLYLKRIYPERFQFKILGTAENFLVSDQTFAVLGIDDALASTTVFPDMELKLYTDDVDVVQQCVERFDHPVLHSNDISAYWNRAVTRYDLGDREGALDDFNQLLTVNPEDAIAYSYRGLVHYDLGNSSAAIADFNHSLEINPRQVSSYCNRGFVRSQQGDQLGAIADYSLAIQNQPDSAIAYFYRGMACQKYNDPLAAVTDFSEAIRLVPDSAISYYYRGQAHQKLENLRGAIADFEAAAKLFTERGNKTNAQKALKSFAKLKHLLSQQVTPQTKVPRPEPVEPEPENLISLLQHVDSVENSSTANPDSALESTTTAPNPAPETRLALDTNGHAKSAALSQAIALFPAQPNLQTDVTSANEPQSTPARFLAESPEENSSTEAPTIISSNLPDTSDVASSGLQSDELPNFQLTAFNTASKDDEPNHGVAHRINHDTSSEIEAETKPTALTEQLANEDVEVEPELAQAGVTPETVEPSTPDASVSAVYTTEPELPVLPPLTDTATEQQPQERLNANGNASPTIEPDFIEPDSAESDPTESDVIESDAIESQAKNTDSAPHSWRVNPNQINYSDHQNSELTSETLSTFFYGVGATDDVVANGSISNPKAPDLPTVLEARATSPNFGDRPEAETLADFCKRFYG